MLTPGVRWAMHSRTHSSVAPCRNGGGKPHASLRTPSTLLTVVGENTLGSSAHALVNTLLHIPNETLWGTHRRWGRGNRGRGREMRREGEESKEREGGWLGKKGMREERGME